MVQCTTNIHYIGAIHKWRHPLTGEGGSAKRRCYSISLFSEMGDKGEGGVKNLKIEVTSCVYGPKLDPPPLISTLMYVCTIEINHIGSIIIYIRKWPLWLIYRAKKYVGRYYTRLKPTTKISIIGYISYAIKKVTNSQLLTFG